MARRFGVRFRRRWGQNFLADGTALEQLLKALALDPADRVLEVGPGLGVLTRKLAARSAFVIAVEIDPACVRALAFTLREIEKVRIVEGDILAQDLEQLVDPPYRVVGNIPYNLTGPLLVQLLEQAVPPQQLDLVVQREVALRLAAPPGSWSLATLGVRTFGEAEVLLTLSREAFYPPPQVASALLRITPYAEPQLPRAELQAFFQFARPFFQARRKQSPHVLALGLGITKAEARAWLAELGIDPTRRAETLGLEEWRRLFHAARANWKLDMMATP